MTFEMKKNPYKNPLHCKKKNIFICLFVYIIVWFSKCLLVASVKVQSNLLGLCPAKDHSLDLGMVTYVASIVNVFSQLIKFKKQPNKKKQKTKQKATDMAITLGCLWQEQAGIKQNKSNLLSWKILAQY